MSAIWQAQWSANLLARRELARLAPRLLVRTLLIVGLCEFVVMLFLHWLEVPTWLENLLDSFLLVLLIVLPFYLLVVRPAAQLAARAALAPAESHYEALVGAVSDAIVVTDAEGSISFCSPAVGNVFGFAPQQLLERPISSLLRLPPGQSGGEDGTRVLKFLEAATVPTEVEGRRADGMNFPAEVSSRPIWAAEDRFLVTVIRDLTERKGAERALRASEERYRTLAEAAPDAIWVVGRDGAIQYVNSYGAKQSGRQPEEMMGRPVQEFLPPQVCNRWSRNLEEMRLAGQPIFEEDKVRFGDREVWLSTKVVPLRDAVGEVTAALGVSRDITERKRAEEELLHSAERFRCLLEALPIAIRLHQQGRVGFSNSADAALLGYEGPEEIIGTDAYALMADEDVSRLREYTTRRAAGGPVPTSYEARAKRRDGSLVPVEITVARVLYGGEPASLLVLYDLRERKRLRLFESLLPACCMCGKVRDDTGGERGKGPWRSLEEYVMEHSTTQLSHTFCPDCYRAYREEQGLPPADYSGSE